MGVLQKAITVDMLLDTGCTQSLIPLGLYNAIPEDRRPSLKEAKAERVVGFSGESTKILGMVPLLFSMSKINWMVEFLVVDGPATPILGMDFFMRNGVVLDFTNSVVWSKEMVKGVKATGEPSGPRVEAAMDITLPPRCESALIGNAPNLPPGSTILVEGSMDDLVSGIGVANTLTVVDGEGQCKIRVMNPHTQAITIPKGTRVGVTTIPMGIESPFPVATAPVAMQRGQLGATEKALRIQCRIRLGDKLR